MNPVFPRLDDPRRTLMCAGIVAGVAGGVLTLAPALPDLGRGTGAVAAGVGAPLALLILAALLACFASVRSNRVALLLLAGAVAVAVAFVSLDVEPVATPARLLAATALGVLLARQLEAAWQIVVVAAIGAVVDTVSVLVGPTGRLAEDSPGTLEAIALHFPLWGDAGTILVGATDFLFVGAFIAGAIRFGLRPRATATAEAVALLVAVCLAAALDRDLPALPFAAAAALIVNADLLRRRPGAGPVVPDPSQSGVASSTKPPNGSRT